MVSPWIGAAAAIAITAAMDASGLSDFSALPLLPLLLLFWRLDRLSRGEAGFTAGRPAYYALALLYPIAAMGALTAFAAYAGALDMAHADWRKAGTNLAIMTLSTFLIAIVTEEGFFRGWLWGSLARAGKRPAFVLVSTSLCFMLWHLSTVLLPTGFDVPARQVPVFLLNATILGLAWGMLRFISGSVLVASASHGLWNGLAYVLFGYGTHAGALGIRDTALYGPEVGLLGLAVNAAIVAALWLAFRHRFLASGPSDEIDHSAPSAAI
jgi:membrane protease YdiL (CAAX protease family)